MHRATAKIFRNGRSQAIRIPAALRFDTDRVIIEKDGSSLIIRPYPEIGWDAFLDDPDLVVDDDFEIPEDMPPQERTSL